MQSQLQLSKLRIAGIAILFLLLISVRIVQKHLFYDPLLEFFESTTKKIPTYDSLKLFSGLLFRYALNSLISLGILWLVFKDKSVQRLTLLLYVVFFIVLIGSFFVVINLDDPGLLLLFYIRRFLIQPLFLILFLPAFYYQKHMK
jgi:exosortase F-associated protein